MLTARSGDPSTSDQTKSPRIVDRPHAILGSSMTTTPLAALPTPRPRLPQPASARSAPEFDTNRPVAMSAVTHAVAGACVGAGAGIRAEASIVAVHAVRSSLAVQHHRGVSSGSLGRPRHLMSIQSEDRKNGICIFVAYEYLVSGPTGGISEEFPRIFPPGRKGECVSACILSLGFRPPLPARHCLRRTERTDKRTASSPRGSRLRRWRR